MRIVHLSDIHLCQENINSFRNHYRESLINDLLKFNREKPIDLIIISGDIVDKAGKSLLKIEGYKDELDPYKIFEIEFIDKITNKLTLPKNRVLFIAGNHDVNREEVDEIQEAGLKSLINSSVDVDNIYDKYKLQPEKINISRIKQFLEFEKRFHQDNKELQYEYSEFISTAIYNYNGNKVGIALVNDSWRCGNGEVNNHFFGGNQLHEARNRFVEEATCFNIAVLHHPLEILNKDEKKSIENILKHREYNIALIGHEHEERLEPLGINISNRCYCARGRSAFDKPHETNSDYISGYCVIDIDFTVKKCFCRYKVYNRETFLFDTEDYEGKPFAELPYGVNEMIIEKVNVEKGSFLINVKKEDFTNNSTDE